MSETTQVRIAEVQINGDEIDRIVAKVAPILVGECRENVIISLLSMCIEAMAPECTAEELAEAISETSRFICLHFAPIATDNLKVN